MSRTIVVACLVKIKTNSQESDKDIKEIALSSIGQLIEDNTILDDEEKHLKISIEEVD